MRLGKCRRKQAKEGSSDQRAPETADGTRLLLACLYRQRIMLDAVGRMSCARSRIPFASLGTEKKVRVRCTRTNQLYSDDSLSGGPGQARGKIIGTAVIVATGFLIV